MTETQTTGREQSARADTNAAVGAGVHAEHAAHRRGTTVGLHLCRGKHRSVFSPADQRRKLELVVSTAAEVWT